MADGHCTLQFQRNSGRAGPTHAKSCVCGSPMNNGQEEQEAAGWDPRQVALSGEIAKNVTAVLHHIISFNFYVSLRSALQEAEQGDGGFDFSRTDWSALFLPLLVAYAIDMLCAIVGLVCEWKWLSFALPQPRLGNAAEAVAQVLSIHVHGVLQPAVSITFMVLLQHRLSGDANVSIWLLFFPWWLMWAVDLVQRTVTAHICASPGSRPPLQPTSGDAQGFQQRPKAR